MGERIKVRSLGQHDEASTFVYEFAQSRVVIGRSRSADVQLPHTAVSGAHASIRAEGAGYVVYDEGSTNGTRVNDGPLVPGRAKPLRANDHIDLGGYRLTVEVGIPVAQTMSSRLASAFAQRMLKEQMGAEGDVGLEAALAAIQQSPDQRLELLPIAKDPPNEPPEPPESRASRPRPSAPSEETTRLARAPLGRSEVAVYVLAALVVATSVIAMALLMRT